MSNIYRQTEAQRQKQERRKEEDFQRLLDKARRDHADKMSNLRGKWARAKNK
ncbi:hypothetical protein [Streptococcus pluranimalium]|uniref:hypothetical protein n=1 Tax=Streptococcus pluranimalium TaxID=82348 RepID=UPI004046ADA0